MPFVRNAPAADVVALFADGTIRLITRMAPDTNTYVRNETVEQVPPERLPKAPTRSAVADFDGDGWADVLVADANGTLLLLRNGESGRFTSIPIRTRLHGVRQLAAGSFSDDKAGRCVWIDEGGNLQSAPRT